METAGGEIKDGRVELFEVLFWFFLRELSQHACRELLFVILEFPLFPASHSCPQDEKGLKYLKRMLDFFTIVSTCWQSEPFVSN